MPVKDDSDGRCRFVLCSQIHQKSLSVRRNCVLLFCDTLQSAAEDANGKQWYWSGCFDRLPIRGELYRNTHHLTVQRHVENLVAVFVPARLCAAVCGDLKPAA